MRTGKKRPIELDSVQKINKKAQLSSTRRRRRRRRRRGERGGGGGGKRRRDAVSLRLNGKPEDEINGLFGGGGGGEGGGGAGGRGRGRRGIMQIRNCCKNKQNQHFNARISRRNK